MQLRHMLHRQQQEAEQRAAAVVIGDLSQRQMVKKKKQQDEEETPQERKKRRIRNRAVYVPTQERHALVHADVSLWELWAGNGSRRE